MFLGGLNLKQFLSEHEEWHALVFGFCETACPSEPRYPKMSDDLKEQIEKENHYYRSGRVVGYMVRVGFIAGIIIGVVATILGIIKVLI